VRVGGGCRGLGGELTVVERLGGETFLYVQVGADQLFIVKAPGDAAAAVHSRIDLDIEGRNCHLFKSNGTALPLLERHTLAA
jgi:multiple sugar transport system ATP-binding protein